MFVAFSPDAQVAQLINERLQPVSTAADPLVVALLCYTRADGARLFALDSPGELAHCCIFSDTPEANANANAFTLSDPSILQKIPLWSLKSTIRLSGTRHTLANGDVCTVSTLLSSGSLLGTLVQYQEAHANSKQIFSSIISSFSFRTVSSSPPAHLLDKHLADRNPPPAHLLDKHLADRNLGNEDRERATDLLHGMRKLDVI